MYVVLTTDRVLHLLSSSLGTDLNELSKLTSLELAAEATARAKVRGSGASGATDASKSVGVGTPEGKEECLTGTDRGTGTGAGAAERPCGGAAVQQRRRHRTAAKASKLRVALASSLSSRFERQPNGIAELSLSLANCTMQIEPEICPAGGSADGTVRTFSVQQLPAEHGHQKHDRAADLRRTVLAAPTEEAMVEWMATFKRLEDDSNMSH